MNPAADARSAGSSERFPEDAEAEQGERPGEVSASDASKCADDGRLTKMPDDNQTPSASSTPLSGQGRALEDALVGVLGEGVALALHRAGDPAGFEAMLPVLARAAALVPGMWAARGGEA